MKNNEEKEVAGLEEAQTIETAGEAVAETSATQNPEAGTDKAPEAAADEAQSAEGAAEEAVTEDSSASGEVKAVNSPSTASFYLRIGGVLTAICVGIALLLALVNSVTAQRIADNTAALKRSVIIELFSEKSPDGAEQLDYEAQSPVASVWEVSSGGVIVGYCANVTASGFGGDIDMMVGADPTGKIAGVGIVSMSETPGLGSKTNSPDFLGQYKDKSGAVTVGRSGTGGVDIDAVAGATISSKAITAGVNSALAAMQPLFTGEIKPVVSGDNAETPEIDDGSEAPVINEASTEAEGEDDTTVMWLDSEGVMVAQSFSPLPKPTPTPVYIDAGHTIYEHETEEPPVEDVIDPDMHYGETEEPETTEAVTSAEPETSPEPETAEVTEETAPVTDNTAAETSAPADETSTVSEDTSATDDTSAEVDETSEGAKDTSAEAPITSAEPEDPGVPADGEATEAVPTATHMNGGRV